MGGCLLRAGEGGLSLFFAAVAWRAARGLVLPIPPLSLGKAATLFVARDLEAIARVAVLAARAPVTSAMLSLALAAAAVLRRGRFALLILRVPQLAAREPLQHRIRVLRLQLPQRRQQLFLCVRPERGGLALEDDGPVSVTWRHAVP
jgi:hypothetical protein